MKVIAKRRRRENRTNYAKRKRLLEGKKPRIVIRKTNKYITIQFVESKLAQDCVKTGVSSKKLIEYGWPENKAGSLKSLAAGYLTGILFGRQISKLPEKHSDAILDIGLIKSSAGSRVYAALKGITESGAEITIKHNPKIFPKEDRIINDKTREFFDKVREKIMESR